jgi:uncharacterized coiled-coil protein SlyX
MTNEDQQIIRGLLAESEGRLEARFETRLAETEARLIARQDRAVESIAADFSELRGETRRHIETLQQRFDNLAPVIISLDARLAAFTRSVDNVLKNHDQTADTLAAQRKAIDELYTRVAKLEQQNRPQQ